MKYNLEILIKFLVYFGQYVEKRKLEAKLFEKIIRMTRGKLKRK